MPQHDFILVFQLTNLKEDPRIHADALRTIDCRPSFGLLGYIAMEISRSATTKLHAKQRAIRDVLQVIPDARLYEPLMVD